ncbi:hypothetical protein CJU89_0906 [Yarrowia sp. B02]|nr:hypothetical protein CJU89_0906 [Yarrowia sp. B02]
MNSLRAPNRIFRRWASRTSGFRFQEYKRLDYPKAPALLRDRAEEGPKRYVGRRKLKKPKEVKEVTQKAKERTQKEAQKVATQKEATQTDDHTDSVTEHEFESQQEAVEFELAPGAVLREKLEIRLKHLKTRQKEFLAEKAAEVARVGGVFAVRKGLVPGIYLHWETAVKKAGKLSVSEWKKFDNVPEAKEWMGRYKTAPGDVMYNPYITQINFCNAQLAHKEEEVTMWYAVKAGRQIGVFKDWEEAADQVVGFPEPKYAAFASENEAYRFLGVSKRAFFESLELDPKETGDEIVKEQLNKDEKSSVYKQERDRKDFAIYGEARMSVMPPKGGSAGRIKMLLFKLLQAQGEINKMAALDKLRKFHIQDLFVELSDMAEEEKQECFASLQNEHLEDAWNVITEPEFWDFYWDHLRKGVQEEETTAGSVEASDGSGDTYLTASDMDSQPKSAYKSTTEIVEPSLKSAVASNGRKMTLAETLATLRQHESESAYNKPKFRSTQPQEYYTSNTLSDSASTLGSWLNGFETPKENKAAEKEEVSYDKLTNISGERVPGKDLVPVQHVSLNNYPTLKNDDYYTKKLFSRNIEYVEKTTTFRDEDSLDILRRFERNWRVFFTSIFRKIAPIAGNHSRRFDNVEAHVAYTDGSMNKHFQAGTSGKAGWGVHFENDLLPDVFGRVPGEQDIERAEILALVMAINTITKHPVYRNQKWELRTDSLWTQRMLEYGWEGQEPTEQMRSHKNYYLMTRLRSLLFINQDISLRYIKADGRYAGAAAADKLAKLGARQEVSESAELFGSEDEDLWKYDPAVTMYVNKVWMPHRPRMQEFPLDRF